MTNGLYAPLLVQGVLSSGVLAVKWDIYKKSSTRLKNGTSVSCLR